MSELGIVMQHSQQADHATGHKHACDSCSFSTSHLPALRTHVAVQHKDKDKLKPLACKFCGYRTSYRGNLKKHVRIHTGEKPFSCQYCGKRFASKSNHKTHETTHTRHKFSKCPVPQCFFMCSQQELDKHISQAHSGLDLTLTKATKLNNMRPSTVENKRLAVQHLPRQLNEVIVGPDTQVVTSSMQTGLPTMIPHLPGLTVFEKEALALPSNTLVWSMQESVVKRESVFPTYGQQPVFPGGVVFPGQIPPEAESDTEKDAEVNMGSSESESCSESTDCKPLTGTTRIAEVELMRRSYSESSPERSEVSENDCGKVVADSTSGKHCNDSLIAEDLSKSSGQISTEEAKDYSKAKRKDSSTAPDCGAITKALFERKLLNSKSEGWAHVAQVVNSLVQSDADADAVVNILVDQGHLFHCMHCNIFFPEYSTYVLHRSCHDHSQPFQCHFCQASFPEKFGFLTHFMQCANKC